MKSACKILIYFRDLVNDTLFIRVCIALSGLFFAGLFSLPLIFCSFPKNFWDIVSSFFCIAVVLGGIYLFFVCIFGSETRLEKLMDYFDPSSLDIFGLLFLGLIFVFVGIFAIPITKVIRLFKPRNIGFEVLQSVRKENDEQK